MKFSFDHPSIVQWVFGGGNDQFCWYCGAGCNKDVYECWRCCVRLNLEKDKQEEYKKKFPHKI